MKSKIILLWVLFVGIMSVSANAIAQPAIINDIVIDTQDSSVKVTITSSQTLQIETFKNDESPANYIVLDVIGSVYTKMPSIIDVSQGAVEKISLVRGEESQISIDGEPYYSLDFLAINLTRAADYRVNQSQSVIDLSIGESKLGETVKKVEQVEKPYIADTAVELTPPIVVSRQLKTVEPEVSSYDYNSYDAINYKAKYEDFPKEIENSSREIEQIQQPEISASKKTSKELKVRRAKISAERKKSVKQIPKKRKGNRGFLFFGRRSVAEQPKEVVLEEKMPIERKITNMPVPAERENYLIDSIVNETIREKQKTSDRIEDLTMELKNLQEALYLSKGQKSELDEKINEILAKLDQLKNSLDDEIKRRQALGEKVDDLIAQRNAYIKAKKDYEDFQMQLNRVSATVDNLNTEVKKTSGKLDLVRFEKRKLEDDVNTMETEYANIKTEYDNTVKIKDSITLTVEKLSREIEELRQKLDKAVEAKSRITADLKNFENQNKFSGAELARLKQLLLDKNAVLIDLSKKYEQIKLNLDLAVSEKFKAEYSYRNAKTEFERIKREIETYLQKQ
ncbi:MAG: hypothetical protein KKD05_10230 [Candidatus Omnitrophica bacterium]|nr:hypothetical protein [Candidatus Omnitrophota bacterium]